MVQRDYGGVTLRKMRGADPHTGHFFLEHAGLRAMVGPEQQAQADEPPHAASVAPDTTATVSPLASAIRVATINVDGCG